MPTQVNWALALVFLTGLSATVSYVANGQLLPLLQRHALSLPNARSSHTVPTPQGGGAAVLLGMLIALLVFAGALNGASLLGWSSVLTVLAALMLAMLGALDDVLGLPVRARLGVQFTAAGVGLAATAWRAGIDLTGGPALLLAAPLLIGLVWFINLSNFMDGIDGITVAEFAPISAALTLLAMVEVVPPQSGLLAAALLGALIGFCPYNRHVARLFLGDAGSLPIGFIAGCLLLQLLFAGHGAAALILPLYYLADATITLALRWWRGEDVTQAHRGHFYQRATGLGWSVPAITRTVGLVNIGLGALAILSVLTNGWLVPLFAVLGAASLTAWLLWTLSREGHS